MANARHTAPTIPAVVLETPTIIKLVQVYSDTLLEEAYSAFRQNPAGDERWHDLKRAMLVYQQARIVAAKTTVADQLARALSNAGIGSWGAIIVQTVTGQAINDILAAG